MDDKTRERWMAARVTHGAYLGGVESPEHSTWRSMLARCHNPNNKHYRYYGGKGVAVGAKGVYETGDTYDELWTKLRKAKAVYPLVFEVRPGFQEA